MDSDGSSDLSGFTQRNPVLPLREKASVNFRSRDCCLSPRRNQDIHVLVESDDFSYPMATIVN